MNEQRPLNIRGTATLLLLLGLGLGAGGASQVMTQKPVTNIYGYTLSGSQTAYVVGFVLIAAGVVALLAGLVMLSLTNPSTREPGSTRPVSTKHTTTVGDLFGRKRPKA